MTSETATRLRQLRRTRRVTQEEVAAAVGVDRSMISKLEKGTDGGLQLMDALASFYGVSIDWLLRGDPAERPAKPVLLDTNEAQLIDLFRKLSKDEAQAILTMIRAASRKL